MFPIHCCHSAVKVSRTRTFRHKETDDYSLLFLTEHHDMADCKSLYYVLHTAHTSTASHKPTTHLPARTEPSVCGKNFVTSSPQPDPIILHNICERRVLSSNHVSSQPSSYSKHPICVSCLYYPLLCYRRSYTFCIDLL